MKTLKKPTAEVRKPKQSKKRSELQCPKMAAVELIERLPNDVTWDQLLYHLEVRQGIERGLAQVEAGQVHDMDEVFDELLRDLDE